MPTRLSSAGAWILHIFVNVTGLPSATAEIVLWIILWYIVGLIILIPLHKALARLLRKRKEVLTWEYDTLRYLVAKAQKQSWVASTNKGITVLFDTTHPDYLHHHDIIRSEITNIETSLWTKIIDDAQRATIEKKQKRYTGLHSIVNIYGRFLSIVTVLIYRLFR